jgi:hypothetical protein
MHSTILLAESVTPITEIDTAESFWSLSLRSSYTQRNFLMENLRSITFPAVINRKKLLKDFNPSTNIYFSNPSTNIYFSSNGEPNPDLDNRYIVFVYPFDDLVRLEAGIINRGPLIRLTKLPPDTLNLLMTKATSLKEFLELADMVTL